MSAVPLCVHHSLEGEHVQALRSRECGCFLVVQTLGADKIQSTTDARSLNTFGRNEIEVAPISSALLRIVCLVILYKTCAWRAERGTPMPRCGTTTLFGGALAESNGPNGEGLKTKPYMNLTERSIRSATDAANQCRLRGSVTRPSW